MIKRLIALVLLWVLLGPAAISREKEDALWQKAVQLTREAIVVDGHVDLPSRILREKVDIGRRLEDGHTDIPRMLEGGLNAPILSIYISAKYADEGAKKALEMIDALMEAVDRNAGQIELARSTSDVYRITGKGKIAAMMGLEGGHILQSSFGVLRMLHRLGIVYVTLTHSATTRWADSSTDKPKWGGLNELGERFVREMNRIGVIVDVAHVSDSTFWDVMRVSEAPVIASHSSCRAICNIPRNMSDDMIKAMAEKGGVIMINFGSSFVSHSWGERVRFILTEIRDKYNGDFSMWGKMWREMQKKDPLPPPTVSDLVDHIEHVIQIAGVDYVGLGSDFDGVGSLPEGLKDASDLPAITYELLKRGYDEEAVRKILGLNFLRVLSEVEARAAELQAMERQKAVNP